MTKQKLVSTKRFLLYSLWFILGILLGYYLGYDHGWEKAIPFPYHAQKPTPLPSCDALTNISPKAGDKVASPLTVTVTVDNTKSCKWTVFEAQAGTLSLIDTTNQTIGTGTLTTSEEWMTDQPVVYQGTIEFTTTPASGDLTLKITEEDPSGQGPQEVTIPLTY
jgi:hypothetical protein